MRLLGHIRSRSKLKSPTAEAQVYSFGDNHVSYQSISNLAAKLPIRVLERIFTMVCPQTLDTSYTTAEESMIDSGCMLCDLLDLSSCSRVCRTWFNSAQNLLYRSVRLDGIHYCEREIELSERRKRTSFFERNGNPKDASHQRLELLERTVRAREYLAALVCFLKMPYMTRETCKADLARTISVMPNLRYVDLPEGFFSDDPASNTLRQELQSRCPEIRKMKYLAGSDTSFARLAHAPLWQNLEILELSGLQLEPDVLLFVLASFPALCQVKLADIPWLDDAMLIPNHIHPLFPPLANLSFENTPGITAAGLVAYLSRPETRELLTNLQLIQTGVLTQDLHTVLALAPHLTNLIFNETASRSFPLTPIPLLASRSLRTLQFDIYPATSMPNPSSETYYHYLATSLLSSALPSLASLFALSTLLPDLLIAFPPLAGHPASQPSTRLSVYPAQPLSSTSSKLPSGIVSPLALYTKPALAPELEWSLTLIDPPRAHHAQATSFSPATLDGAGPDAYSRASVALRSSSPHSVYGRSKCDTVLVGNGFGGFLAVPSEEGVRRPMGREGRGGEWMG